MGVQVIKESGELSLSWVKNHAFELGISAARTLDPLRERAIDVHLHFPAGAQKKDGPSAGVAIVAAVLRTTRDVRAAGIRKSVGLCSAPDRNGIPVGVEELWTVVVRDGHAPRTGAGGGCDLETTGEVVRVSFGRSHDDVRGLMMAAWRRGRGSLLRGGGW